MTGPGGGVASITTAAAAAGGLGARGLWRSDGTRAGTRMVRNIRPGSASSQPLFLTNVNGTLYFTAKDGRHGRELWRAGPRLCRTAKGKCK